jgi:hypothetical protein
MPRKIRGIVFVGFSLVIQSRNYGDQLYPSIRKIPWMPLIEDARTVFERLDDAGDLYSKLAANSKNCARR